ncbi:MAG: ATP-binding protein [Luteibacter sp.]
MKSLQWRVLAALGLVILFAWAMSITMFVSYINYGQTNFWRSGLHDLGDKLVEVLPDGAVPATPASVAVAAGGNATTQGHAAPVHGAAVSEPASILTAMVLNTAELAIVGVLTWWALMAALRPLRAMSTGLAHRDPYDSAPLPVDQVPTELRPLITAFNTLLARVDTAMRAERQFIADAAHELRTPLAALHVQAEVALAADTMEAKDIALERLLEVSQRTHRLAEQLLDLARLDAGLHASGMVPADLLELSRHVLSEFRIQAAERDIRLQLDGGSCLVHCDVDEMGILIRNLVDNAIRHGRAGGQVTVACLSVARGGGEVRLEVVDDGPGVPDADLRSIFDRFYRAPGTTTQGSGIGLSLVAGIAALHGATVEARRASTQGGLKVAVTFPATLKDS